MEIGSCKGGNRLEFVHTPPPSIRWWYPTRVHAYGTGDKSEGMIHFPIFYAMIVCVIVNYPAAEAAPALLYKSIQTGVSVKVGLPDLHPSSAKEKKTNQRKTKGSQREKLHSRAAPPPSSSWGLCGPRPCTLRSGGVMVVFDVCMSFRCWVRTGPRAPVARYRSSILWFL